jgi:glycosyltransferase involved in cell wall biosynthesis
VPKIEYPTEVDLSDLPNVTVLEPRAEVGEIYAQTRLLLVPSQWEETFGRVAIEAFANGIPVIGSSVGGLKEHVGEAGILVEEKRDVGAWVRAIEELDAPERYEELRARGVAFGARRRLPWARPRGPPSAS